MKLESKHDSASAWVEAAKAFQKVDQKSKQCRTKLHHCVNFLVPVGVPLNEGVLGLLCVCVCVWLYNLNISNSNMECV